MAEKPEVIFFDVGNTLLFPNWARILAPLTERGVLPTHEQLRATECKTKGEFDEMMAGGRRDRGFWRLFYAHLLEELEVSDAKLEDALAAATTVSMNWDRIRPGTREALEQIGGAYRIAVISNADGKIAEVLQQCGIADCFLSVTDSTVVGHEKPHPAIFAAAIQSMNTRAERALYVGDLYSVDYLGARGAGMEAILFDVAGAYRDKGPLRVESLSELQQMLQAREGKPPGGVTPD
ncbi:MAG TPA: HAD family hydrolase [Candidatus Angelobacter sp.]|nr:HAD family hydrolase [Candidatus Angelobacter sp.]